MTSLVHRFHRAGWIHRSVAERNILVQPGPITMPSSQRFMEEGQGAPERKFRLIDFGRSSKPSTFSESQKRIYDEWALDKML